MFNRVMVKNENELMLLSREVNRYFKDKHIVYPSVLVFDLQDGSNEVRYGWVVPKYIFEDIEEHKEEIISVLEYVNKILSAKEHTKRKLNE